MTTAPRPPAHRSPRTRAFSPAALAGAALLLDAAYLAVWLPARFARSHTLHAHEGYTGLLLLATSLLLLVAPRAMKAATWPLRIATVLTDEVIAVSVGHATLNPATLLLLLLPGAALHLAHLRAMRLAAPSSSERIAARLEEQPPAPRSPARSRRTGRNAAVAAAGLTVVAWMLLRRRTRR